MTPPLPDRIAAAIHRYTIGRSLGARDGLIAIIAEVVAEREAATKRADGLAAELDELRTAWFGIAGGENSFPSDHGGDCIAQQQVGAWLADGAKARSDLAAAQAKLAELRGWCSQRRAEWTAEARGASSKSVSASCSMAASAFDDVAKKIAEVAIAAAEQGGA